MRRAVLSGGLRRPLGQSTGLDPAPSLRLSLHLGKGEPRPLTLAADCLVSELRAEVAHASVTLSRQQEEKDEVRPA